jgi:hypothetical protein
MYLGLPRVVRPSRSPIERRNPGQAMRFQAPANDHARQPLQ